MIAGIVFASIAVQWHRRVLSGERAAEPAPLVRIMTSYALVAIGMEWLFVVPIYVSANIINLVGEAGAFSIVAATVLYILVVCYVTSRAWFVLPSIALNEPDKSLARSWLLTKGNGWRLFSGGVLAALPAFVVTVSSVSSDLALNLAGFVIATFGVSFLSIAYRELVMKKAAG